MEDDLEEALSYCSTVTETLRGVSGPERERAGLAMIQVRLARGFLALGRAAAAADSMRVDARRTLSSGVRSAHGERAIDSLSARLAAGG